MNKEQQDEMKEVKQALSAVQMHIKHALEAAELPREEDAANFIARSNDMDRLCENIWRKAMDNYMDLLEQFRAGVDAQDLQAIKGAFHGLLDCKVSCHKEFRQR
jgi:XXXCH domain-containing protein